MNVTEVVLEQNSILVHGVPKKCQSLENFGYIRSAKSV